MQLMEFDRSYTHNDANSAQITKIALRNVWTFSVNVDYRRHSPTLKMDYFKKPKNQATYLVYNPQIWFYQRISLVKIKG